MKFYATEFVEICGIIASDNNVVVTCKFTLIIRGKRKCKDVLVFVSGCFVNAAHVSQLECMVQK